MSICPFIYQDCKTIHTICIDLAWAITLLRGKQELQTLVGSSSPYCGNIICRHKRMYRWIHGTQLCNHPPTISCSTVNDDYAHIYGIWYVTINITFSKQHLPHNTLPQTRQWCRLRTWVNFSLHKTQKLASESGTHLFFEQKYWWFDKIWLGLKTGWL